MSGLVALLAGRREPGVYRWAAAFEPEDLRVAIAPSRWELAHLDGWAATTRRDVLVALGAALGFPDHYGANLDALWDALRDLPAPTVVLWDGWSVLAHEDPAGLGAVVRVLQERAVEARDLVVLLQGPGPDLDPDLGVTLLE